MGVGQSHNVHQHLRVCVVWGTVVFFKCCMVFFSISQKTNWFTLYGYVLCAPFLGIPAAKGEGGGGGLTHWALEVLLIKCVSIY